jgi:hypothetical protein
MKAIYEGLRRDGLVNPRVFRHGARRRRLKQVIEPRQLDDANVAIAALPERGIDRREILTG